MESIRGFGKGIQKPFDEIMHTLREAPKPSLATGACISVCLGITAYGSGLLSPALSLPYWQYRYLSAVAIATSITIVSVVAGKVIGKRLEAATEPHQEAPAANQLV